MSETQLHDDIVDRDGPVPFRGANGLRVTSRSRGQRGPRDYVVRAPNGDPCQLGEEEHFLLTLLDGKRSFDEITQAFQSRFDENLSPEHFRGFIDELQAAGVIERVDGETLPSPTAPDEFAPQAFPTIEQPGAAKPAATEWNGDVVRAADTDVVPLYRAGTSLEPLFMLLARIGSPLRYFAWFLIPAVALAGIGLYLDETRLLAALAGVDWRSPAVMASGLGAVLAAFLVPNLCRGTAAAFHGAPRETYQIVLRGRVLPWLKIDRGWIRTLPRKAQAWAYASPLLARLAVFAIGVAMWLSAPAASPYAVAGMVAGCLGLWSFLLTATPLWPCDGRRWLAVYFDEPALDRALWHALRIRGRESYERWGRGFVAVAAVISLAAIAGAGLLWAGLTWDAFRLPLGAIGEAVSSWLGPWPWLGTSGSAAFAAARDALSSWFGAARTSAVRDAGAWLSGGAYTAGLVWLGSAHVSVGTLRAPAGGWDGVSARGIPDGSLGQFAPMGRGSIDTLAPSLDERLHAGGQSWPSNVKVLILAAIIVVGLSVAFLSYPYESGGTFTILPYTSYQQDARVAGEVTEVLVREGEWVKEGQVIATMADWNEVHNLAVTKASLEKASAQLQDLLLLPKPEQVTLARQQYEQAASRLPFSKADYERELALVHTGAVSVRQFEQTQSNYEQDKAAVAVTKANYELVRVGATQPEIDAARATVRLATAQVSYAEDQLARTRIRATTSGTVVTPNPQLLYGKYLKVGETFVLLQDNRVAQVEVQVPETDIRDIQLGGRVRAKAWGYERTTWTGKVTLIAHDATPTKTLGNIVRVVAEVPNSNGLLRPQMSGYAKVQTVEMPVWVSFTRALVRFVLVEVWSWIP